MVKDIGDALRDHDSERIVTPPRSGFNYEHPHTGLIEWMPLYQNGKEVTIKIVGYHPANPDTYGLPSILSTISSYDTATGHLRCLMDGVLPTALRTAAASVVAAGHLARPDSRVLGVIGCGAQAVAHVQAFCQFYPIERILVCDSDSVAAESLSTRCQTWMDKARMEVCPVADIVGQVDLLLTATSIPIGEGPLFEHAEHLPHLHVSAIGSDFPGKTELPLSLLERAFVCPDFRPQAVVEGECQQLAEHRIGADIVSVAKDPERFAPLRDKLTVYDSTGWSLQDQIALRLFIELATEIGLGQRVEVENLTGSAKNPYGFLIPVAPSLTVG
jgi:ornithine cyclodeaminase/alanine dehydrogenase-like protein (mu-crystallin family)